ncbi:probable serine/threonine-protein kinase PBL19 [Punica granatum]|uniref:Protein kinase domain-containing protein n=2 Tax=Punica granatum TaxID=22663 RepID=A0A218XU32_PUNGR|nr:probable serine/threonine-protein kinase PBL19 [Punica granatum]OWM88318.1 hypothetical protein CDL15_Pgr003730 [Punica granatum]PKI46934.1 hypothetical protein CRG98_032745 [Punica granatum]
MNCFSFKGRSKSKQKSESAPELDRRDGLPGTSGASDRTVKSLGSQPSTPRSIPELYKEKEHMLRVFSYDELREATCGFSRMLKIGQGGFGSVYKGTVKPISGKGEPLTVAIKKLNSKSLQGYKEWMSEVQFLGVVSHPNLVKLLGYSSMEGERGIQLLLVYEYMANRSLDDHLFSRTQPPMPWKTRLEIVLGAAQGLAYLHDGMEVKIIFRDFKSSNVLLDENFKAKLSDFGLAREGPTGDHTHVTTRIVGTYGYAAPEYVETGHLTIHSDIWTFGVVLYEILTGRRAVERNRPANEQKLLDWVKGFPVDSRKFTMIIDPKLRNHYPLASARKVAKLAEMCLNKNPKDRPTMGQIVSVLKDAIRDSEGASSSSSGNVGSSSRSKTGSPSTGKKIVSY